MTSDTHLAHHVRHGMRTILLHKVCRDIVGTLGKTPLEGYGLTDPLVLIRTLRRPCGIADDECLRHIDNLVAWAHAFLHSHDVGVDIDAQSVKVANENAEINNVTDKTQFIVGDLANKISDKYSVICANIVADVILKLLENVADFMEESAILITSGIINIRRDDVVEGFKKFGFEILEEHNKDNWYAFVCRKGE